MLKGSNQFSLNEATIIEALEYWFNNVILKEPIKISKVDTSRINTNITFEIYVEEEKNPK